MNGYSNVHTKAKQMAQKTHHGLCLTYVTPQVLRKKESVFSTQAFHLAFSVTSDVCF